MANDVPHDKGFPALPPVELAGDFAAEPEVEPEPLPLSVRPFDPARYHPKTHIIPVAGGIHTFTDFDEGAPADLLLREMMSHLSAIAVEVRSLLFCSITFNYLHFFALFRSDHITCLDLTVFHTLLLCVELYFAHHCSTCTVYERTSGVPILNSTVSLINH